MDPISVAMLVEAIEKLSLRVTFGVTVKTNKPNMGA